VPEKCQLHKLSFGQKKKIHIAFALAANTNVLIMDEPTNGLDIPSKIEFREIIARTRRDDKITIMFTYQVFDLDGLIDSVIIIDQGRVLLAGDKEEIWQKLCFGAKRAGDDTIIYGIDAPGGRMTVSRNTGAETSTLDLELLLTRPSIINRVSGLFFKPNKIDMNYITKMIALNRRQIRWPSILQFPTSNTRYQNNAPPD